MSIQTIVAAAEPPEQRGQPTLFGPAPKAPAAPKSAPAMPRPGSATTYKWGACLRNQDCGTCADLYAEAIRTVPWDQIPQRPQRARHTRKTLVGRVVMTTEDFCTPHAETQGYKGRA